MALMTACKTLHILKGLSVQQWDMRKKKTTVSVQAYWQVPFAIPSPPSPSHRTPWGVSDIIVKSAANIPPRGKHLIGHDSRWEKQSFYPAETGSLAQQTNSKISSLPPGFVDEEVKREETLIRLI